MMTVEGLDHLVLTVRDIDATCSFYSTVLGMRVVEFGGGRKALAFGRQKMNLHEAGQEFSPHARRPEPGAADLCFLSPLPLEKVILHLAAHRVEIVEGPVRRTGAVGPLLSVYVMDPDGNLLEIANQLSIPQQAENYAT
jgi:catechol 2,3-dioxygenase-like lactoylglutathione lyase family enzyme